MVAPSTTGASTDPASGRSVEDSSFSLVLLLRLVLRNGVDGPAPARVHGDVLQLGGGQRRVLTGDGGALLRRGVPLHDADVVTVGGDQLRVPVLGVLTAVRVLVPLEEHQPRTVRQGALLAGVVLDERLVRAVGELLGVLAVGVDLPEPDLHGGPALAVVVHDLRVRPRLRARATRRLPAELPRRQQILELPDESGAGHLAVVVPGARLGGPLRRHGLLPAPVADPGQQERPAHSDERDPGDPAQHRRPPAQQQPPAAYGSAADHRVSIGLEGISGPAQGVAEPALEGVSVLFNGHDEPPFLRVGVGVSVEVRVGVGASVGVGVGRCL